MCADEALSTPNSYDDSLASILDVVVEKSGRRFVRLFNENDKRGPDQLKKKAGIFALWECIECFVIEKALISNVTSAYHGCSRCSGPGVVAKIVIEFLIYKFGEKNVEKERWINDYYIDARIRFGDDSFVDVEIDGAQHYLRTAWSRGGRKLEDRISADVEKMRLASSEFVPTVRIPTVAVPVSSRGVAPEVNEPWKILLMSSIEAARIVSVNAIVENFLRADDVMFIVEGHENKYDAHEALLQAIFAGGRRVIFNDMDLLDARFSV
jgi:hypothetical protein